MSAEVKRTGYGGSGARVGLEERWRPDAVERLRDLYPSLRRFAAVVGSRDVDPDDLVQDAFAKILAKDPDDIRELGPYLRRMIVNLATDERRRSTRSTRTNGALGRSGAALVSTDSYPSDLEDLMRVEPRVRALLYLVELEGQPVADAAVLVGMSNSGARVALMRARRRLRAELATEANDE